MPFKFHTTTDDALNAMLYALKKAEKSICLEHFILNVDDTGISFIEALRERARAGVDVRMILDAAGSHNLWLSTDLVEDMKKDGIKIVFFNTFIIGLAKYYDTIFFRDHSKLVIIDEKIGFTGGVCIAERMRPWRDICVEVEGSVVHEMLDVFNKMWRGKGKRWYRQQNPRLAHHNTHYVRNLPLPRRRHLYDALIEAIRSSTTSVYLTTPYFVPNRALVGALIKAVRRGVDVRILIPIVSDHPLVDYGGQSLFHKLLTSGVNIYRYTPGMLHTKAAVIDAAWATVGSMNYDIVSLRYNIEANIVSIDSDFVAQVGAQFAADLEYTERLTIDTWEKRPFIEKIKSVVLGFFKLYL